MATGIASGGNKKIAAFAVATEYIWGNARPNVVSFSDLSRLGSYDTGSRTFTATKKVKVSFNATMQNFNSNNNGIALQKNGGTIVSSYSQTDPSAFDRGSNTTNWTGVLEPGDTLTNLDTGALGGASWTGWSLTATEIADATQSISEATKWQKKFLSSDFPGSGVMTELTFNNLTIGKTYRISGQLATQAVSVDNNNKERDYQIKNGTTVLSWLRFKKQEQRSIRAVTPVESIFTATDATLTCEVTNDAITETGGDAGGTLTYLVLEELPNHIQVTEWI